MCFVTYLILKNNTVAGLAFCMKSLSFWVKSNFSYKYFSDLPKISCFHVVFKSSDWLTCAMFPNRNMAKHDPTFRFQRHTYNDTTLRHLKVKINLEKDAKSLSHSYLRKLPNISDYNRSVLSKETVVRHWTLSLPYKIRFAVTKEFLPYFNSP